MNKHAFFLYAQSFHYPFWKKKHDLSQNQNSLVSRNFHHFFLNTKDMYDFSHNQNSLGWEIQPIYN